VLLSPIGGALLVAAVLLAAIRYRPRPRLTALELRSVPERVRAWGPRVVVFALVAFAYRPLAIRALQLPSAYQLETWLFRPSQLPLPLVLDSRLAALAPARTASARGRTCRTARWPPRCSPRPRLL